MDNKQISNTIRHLFDEGFSKENNLKTFDEVFSDNLKWHDFGYSLKAKSGLASFKEAETAYRRAFPHKKVIVDDIIVQDNKAIVRWTCQGKHNGEFQGLAPTHRPFTVSGISIYVFTGNKISEIWQTWDRLNLLEQLGVSLPIHAAH